MSEIFLKLFNMSFVASVLVIAVILLRPLLGRAPKWIRLIFWGFAGIRLICPLTLKSILSLIPSEELITNKILTGPSFRINSGITAIDSTVNGYLGDNYFEGVSVAAESGKNIVDALSVIWLSGVILLLVYMLVSYLTIRIRVNESVLSEKNIYICDKINAPFILGIIAPKIYLPSTLEAMDSEYVIAHERAHIKRLDYIWKPLGFILLSVYWFNPLLWVSYALLCRDIELACDEKVINSLGSDIKKAYSQALINCSISHKTVSACPLAFGENSVKLRIKSVLAFKKKGVVISVAALILAVIFAVCFLTNPTEGPQIENNQLTSDISSQTELSFKTSNNVKLTGYSFGYNEENSPYVYMCITNYDEHNILEAKGQDFYILDGDTVVEPTRTVLYDSRKITAKYKQDYEGYFNLNAYDLADNKQYRIVVNYKFSGFDNVFGIYLDFAVDSSALKGTLLHRETTYWYYASADEKYEEPLYTFLLGEDNRLYTQNYNHEENVIKKWYEVGKMHESSLEDAGIRDISGGKWVVTGESLESIKNGNDAVFRYEINDSGDYYYILRQNYGGYFLFEYKNYFKKFTRIIKLTSATSEPLTVDKVALNTLPSKSALYPSTQETFLDASDIGKYLNGDHWTIKDAGSWAKLNPANPQGRQYITIQFADTSYMHLNLFFSEKKDVAYAAFVKDIGPMVDYTGYETEDYTRVILSDEFKSYIIDNILN